MSSSLVQTLWKIWNPINFEETGVLKIEYFLFLDNAYHKCKRMGPKSNLL